MMMTLFTPTSNSNKVRKNDLILLLKGESTYRLRNGPDQAGTLLISEGADAAFPTQGLSTARPMACNPLST
jgi:hypothetical protein